VFGLSIGSLDGRRMLENKCVPFFSSFSRDAEGAAVSHGLCGAQQAGAEQRGDESEHHRGRLIAWIALHSTSAV
jgi:hypothetical protein